MPAVCTKALTQTLIGCSIVVWELMFRIIPSIHLTENVRLQCPDRPFCQLQGALKLKYQASVLFGVLSYGSDRSPLVELENALNIPLLGHCGVWYL